MITSRLYLHYLYARRWDYWKLISTPPFGLLPVVGDTQLFDEHATEGTLPLVELLKRVQVLKERVRPELAQVL